MKFHIISLFPDSIKPYLDDSILGRAQEDKKITVKYYNPRDFTKDKWRRVDRRPYGGGPGMVLEAPSVLRAVERAMKKSTKPVVLFLSTAGKPFTNRQAQGLSRVHDLIIIAGHYEGVDARVQKVAKAKKISIGPYVLTGGEQPAMVIIDAVARRIPGVLGKLESLEELRAASPDVYTRPEVFSWKGKKYRVPKVLLSGHHAKIEEW